MILFDAVIREAKHQASSRRKNISLSFSFSTEQQQEWIVILIYMYAMQTQHHVSHLQPFIISHWCAWYPPSYKYHQQQQQQNSSKRRRKKHFFHSLVRMFRFTSSHFLSVHTDQTSKKGRIMCSMTLLFMKQKKKHWNWRNMGWLCNYST